MKTASPAHPRVNDRLFRAYHGGGGVYAVRRYRCIAVFPTPGVASRWSEEDSDCAGHHDTLEAAVAAAHHLNRAEPWYEEPAP